MLTEPFGALRPRAIPALAAMCCLLLGGWLSWHHPLAPTLTTLAFLLWSTAAFLRPNIWLMIVPALLPIVDLAPWTGWLIVEEFDLLVLGAGAGAYASIALRATGLGSAAMTPQVASVVRTGVRAPSLPADGRRPSAGSMILIMCFGVWTAVGLCRGLSAAGWTELDWSDGYYAATNSLRIAKSYLLALLMLPPLVVEMRRSDAGTTGALSAGLVAGLSFASLAVLWERVAFPGLLNFSGDYRATALFWEMHVGGAALDGFLALSVPFAIREVLVASTYARRTAAVLCLFLAAYACLTTFSRGLYFAVSVSMCLLAFLLLTKGNARLVPSATLTMLKVSVLIAVMGVLALWIFRAGGYRSLLAVLGVFALTLPLGNIARDIAGRAWAAGLALGVLAGAAGSAMSMLLYKGIYVNFALAFGCCALLLLHGQISGKAQSKLAALGAYVWVIVAAAGVALGWGGAPALRSSATVLLILAALMVWSARTSAPRWPRELHWQGAMFVAAALVAVTAAVFGGGAYMSDRFASTERDAAGRLQHWRDGIDMLQTSTDWLIGMGAGRFPQNYMFSAGDREFPGSSHTVEHGGQHYLVLSGPRHEGGFGEMFRVAQRVPVLPGRQYSVVVDVSASEAALLHLEICDRHLLYVDGCAIAQLSIPARGESLQQHVSQLDSSKLDAGTWYAPRLAFFAMATESPGTSVVIHNVSLIGPDGRELLGNGNFAEGMARWFTTSDRFHLPWHIKNIGLNLLFDQGMIGLLLFVLLSCGALYRLVAGAARGHPFAPFLAAALVGFLLVGLFDSLLDVPRLAFLYYLLLMTSVALPKCMPSLVNFTHAPHASRRRRSSGQS